MRRFRITVMFAISVLGITLAPASAGAADYPVNSGSLDVTQNGNAVTSVSPGSTVTVSGSGFASGASVSITIASTPTLLATVSANGAGAISTDVTIPTSIEAGTHTLSATGADPGGGSLVLSSTITVTGSGSSSDSGTIFARTGANTVALVAAGLSVVGLGVLFMVVTRRRAGATTQSS